MNQWAINQKVHLKEKPKDSFARFSLPLSHLLRSSSIPRSCTKKSSGSMYLSILLWTPEIHQFSVSTRPSFKEKTTWNRQARVSLQSLVKLYHISLQDQKDMLNSWKRPAVISSLGRSLQTRKQGPIVILYFVPRTSPWQGTGLESLGLGETLLALFLRVYSLHKFKVGKSKEKKGKLHSYLVLKRKVVCLKPSKLYLIG